MRSPGFRHTIEQIRKNREQHRAKATRAAPPHNTQPSTGV